MSTLATRIAGYLFTVETLDNGNYLGQFQSEDGDGMSLPFELRSAYESITTLPLLGAAYEAYLTLRERVEWVADSHQYDGRPCQCDQCKIASAMFSRTHIVGRKGLI
jgi:hypothetical protein